jgi:hypothetical protein
MNQRPGLHAPVHYELRVEGHLDERWSAWFGGLAIICEDDGTTTLRGEVTDQAELHGLLTKVRDLGTTLISVKVVDPPGGLGVVGESVAPVSPSRVRSDGSRA